LYSLGKAGVREANRVGNGVTVDVGAIVGVRDGFGVKVKREVGVMEAVDVDEELISEDMRISVGSGDDSSGGESGLFRIKIKMTNTITNTTPNKPIRKICWLDVFCSLSCGG
jgi:hypothetical protein